MVCNSLETEVNAIADTALETSSNSPKTNGRDKSPDDTAAAYKNNIEAASSVSTVTPNVAYNKTLAEEFIINKKLIPIKLANLCFHGGMYSFLPYITLHMKQIGLTNGEIATIYAILPISSILGPLISGFLADKLNGFKIVFITNVFFTAFMHTLLLVTPQAPELQGVTLTCDGSGGVLRWRPQCYTDVAREMSYDWMDTNITFQTCHLSCQSPTTTSAELCQTRGNITDCSPVEMNDMMSLEARIGLLPVGPLDNDNHGICLNTGNPVIANFTREGVHYDFLSCAASCPIHCDVLGVPDLREAVNSQYTKTFWIYLALRLPAQFFIAAAFSMIDAVSMAVVAEHGGDFGKTRTMSMMSLGIAPLVSSLLVSMSNKTAQGTADYAPVFYFGDALALLSIIVTTVIKIERPKSESRNMLKDMMHLLYNFEIVLFLLVILVLGSNWGFLESFLFVYLTDMNAPPYLLGLTLTFACMAGIPALFLSERIIAKVGRTNIFKLSFIAYSVRMLGYSLITNPWYSLPFEGLEIITYQLMWVASVTYFPILAPASLLASMSGLAGTVHYNVGRGAGALLGGQLMDTIGSVQTFRVFSVLSLVSGIIYFCIRYFYPDPTVDQTEVKEEKDKREQLELKDCHEKTTDRDDGV